VEEVKRCVVMTTGCYDILHAGHIRHLEKARSLGTKLIVAMNSDKSVRSLKGESRPINPENQRRAILEALRCVDEVRVTDDPMDLVREVRPQVLAVGHGYTTNTIVGREFVESYGGRAVVTCDGDASDQPSTTKIVKCVMQSRDVVEICRLGAAYSVNPLDKLKLMADEFLKVADLDGDVADLGAYRGGTSLILRRLRPDKYLHVFDTWAGTPIDDDLCHHKRGEWVAKLGDCKAVVGKSELTYYHEGVFPYSPELMKLLGLDERQYCFVYVDMDTYQATRDAIALFWPRLVAGGKLFFDDFGWAACSGVLKAVREVFTNDQLRVVQSQYACIVEKQ
jgi:rfaE bifunctional protein nucleotidyltransferase chain/domain